MWLMVSHEGRQKVATVHSTQCWSFGGCSNSVFGQCPFEVGKLLVRVAGVFLNSLNFEINT